MKYTDILPNPGKSLTIDVDGQTIARLPIRTKVIVPDDDIETILREAVGGCLIPGDIVCISEKAVAITERRSFFIRDIKPSRMARLLCRFVKKTPHGIGLGMPETMELALREVGAPLIMLAAAAAAVTKPLGIRGVFYRVAGRKAAAIDGPTPNTLPPYNECATLSPANPRRTARDMAAMLGHPVAIVDANDLGVEVLGSSDGVNSSFVCKAFRDNPLGQSSEQTPIAILRVVNP
jgi:hypothetical protein